MQCMVLVACERGPRLSGRQPWGDRQPRGAAEALGCLAAGRPLVAAHLLRAMPTPRSLALLVSWLCAATPAQAVATRTARHEVLGGLQSAPPPAVERRTCSWRTTSGLVLVAVQGKGLGLRL